jgi:HEAT repeat protein
MANEHLAELRQVLKESADEYQRAIAAYVIGYATKKAEVVNDLQGALRDPDSVVRNNAARALVAFSVLQRLKPESGVRVSPTWFIEMLNSLSWSDRNKAVWALQTLTDNRDPVVLDQLRDRALPSLVEMARWKSPGHAISAFMLLGRIAGLPEQQLEDAWSRGDRESVIAAAAARKK